VIDPILEEVIDVHTEPAGRVRMIPVGAELDRHAIPDGDGPGACPGIVGTRVPHVPLAPFGEL
jgi:hypothetical protein